MPFYKVIILQIDIYLTEIIAEKHFATSSQAREYALEMSKLGLTPVIASFD